MQQRAPDTGSRLQGAATPVSVRAHTSQSSALAAASEDQAVSEDAPFDRAGQPFFRESKARSNRRGHRRAGQRLDMVTS
jgi:hypothetical protein